eukprot:gnl/TRDRNA2_/TRDRNA2_174820_c4_seq1.p1 gnl/TRDRNA2_/TRDRNA2_174820_c4~~gnl/TRDRNA2_/TRDRNA2_174820_c4_seq1.p1  ORF type:complete len:509 (+),score=95.36 gnl/TRDRNA2_/TRDRNA2_174820_c4_seq1:303-1829(+)
MSPHLGTRDLLAIAGEVLRFHTMTHPDDTSTPPRALFIVGQYYDWYHYATDESYQMPLWLQEGLQDVLPYTSKCTTYGFERDNLVGPTWVSSDVAVAAFVRHFFPDIEVYILDSCRHVGNLKDQAFLDQFDVVFNNHYPPFGEKMPIESMYDPISSSDFENALRKTRAAVWNPPWISVDTNKSHQPLAQRMNRVPAVDTIAVTLPLWDSKMTEKEAHKAATSVSKDFIATAVARGWRKAFIKSDSSGYMRHLGKFDLSKGNMEVAITGMTKYVLALMEEGKPGFCGQKYIASFKDNYEMRHYFFGGHFGTVIGNKVDAHAFSNEKDYFFHWDWLDVDGGILNSTAMMQKEKLVPLAKRALEVITVGALEHAKLPPGAHAHPVVRVDLGCCLEPGEEGYDVAGGWFVNEMHPFADSNLGHFTRMLVNTYEESTPFYEDARMVQMVQRAAAAWYPTTEHAGLEMARFIKDVVGTDLRENEESGTDVAESASAYLRQLSQVTDEKYLRDEM